MEGFVSKELEEKASEYDSKRVKKESILEGKGFLLHNLLDSSESQLLIKAAEVVGYDEKASGNRFCLRKVHQDERFQKWLWDRIQPFVIDSGYEYYTDEYDIRWKVCGINPSFRSCKYNPGHVFGPHIDYSNVIGDQRSWYTIMLYLNDSGEFEGGATIFLDPKKPMDARGSRFETVLKIEPGCGMAIIFEQNDQNLLHEGEEIRKGFKYMIRSDIMYETETFQAKEDESDLEAFSAFDNSVADREDDSDHWL
eukprot:TRINITY_DN8827_c0_g1_i2.p1 TRINITY_DN8827_c0_g1~~TRINITY_DN8827_c0_g1_i2.p1  ORF type:complete len:253 (-),score=47.30 TRINITY_DN8827_c0_g1_i2:149-907(-)